MGDLVLQSERNGIVTWTLNRPDSANALSGALLDDLLTAAEKVRYDRAARVVIITGAGEKAFCAGADLKERKGMNEEQVHRAVGKIRDAVESIASLPIPTIAAINGSAFGGGTELALACDLRIASRQAQMGLTETGLAIIPGAGGTQRLPRLIGVAQAKELIFTARRIGAARALELGLVNHVVDSENLLTVAEELAEEIAKNGPIAVRQAKLAIDDGMGVDLSTGIAIERMAYEVVIPTEDRLEGLQAFAEKRTPKYRGK